MDIPFGPYKMNGLPGIILELKSDDGVLHIVAEKMSKSVDNQYVNQDISRIRKLKTISFQAYQEKMLKLLNEKPSLK